MRNIKELLELYPENRLWFEISDKKYKRKFVKQLNELNLKYSNGDSVTVKNCSIFMAIGNGKPVTHVSPLVYGYSKHKEVQNKFSNVLRIRFNRFYEGEEDFLL